MNKFNVNDPAIKELLADPRVQELYAKHNEFVAAEYKRLDESDFVGEAPGGLIHATYCVTKKGFYKVDIDNSVYADKTFACNLLPLAFNDALIKYHIEFKAIEESIINLETEMFTKLVPIAMEKHNGVQPSTLQATPNKKTYLN